MNYYEFLISHGSYSFACGDLLPSWMILNCVTMNDEKFKETDTYLLFNKLFDAFCVFYTNFQWSESSDQWMIFFLFPLCSTRLLTICKNNVTCFKIKIYRSVILIFMLKILPLSVLLYNYLQVFFHSLHLQKISINRYKIGPFQYNIIIYSVIYNQVYPSVFKI